VALSERLKYELHDRKRKRMKSQRTNAIASWTTIALVCLSLVLLSHAATDQGQETAQPPASSATAKPVGTVKAISGNTITLTTDAGAAVDVVVPDSTRLIRIAPGQKDLKDATPIQLSDVQVGDRILARGKASDDGKSVTASSVILMKESDVTAKQERDREDWQKRGVGGLVSKVDAANGIVMLSDPPASESKPVTIQVSKSTIVRRYSPDSVKFDDAKPSTVDEIHPGDQLRARGVRSADGTELAADEVVSGTFRNIAGLVTATDASANTITVMDLATKKPVTLAITSDSQLRKLPPTVAQRVAQRLRGGSSDGAAQPSASTANSPDTAKMGQTAPSGNVPGARPGGLPDFQQILKRMPSVTLADLQKGDAVMVVTTEGTASTQPTAITLLSGVETILSASPTGNQAAMLLSPWNLGGGGGDAAAGTNP
jgi:co-chaperonin GroES (HSP10)